MLTGVSGLNTVIIDKLNCGTVTSDGVPVAYFVNHIIGTSQVEHITLGFNSYKGKRVAMLPLGDIINTGFVYEQDNSFTYKVYNMLASIADYTESYAVSLPEVGNNGYIDSDVSYGDLRGLVSEPRDCKCDFHFKGIDLLDEFAYNYALYFMSKRRVDSYRGRIVYQLTKNNISYEGTDTEDVWKRVINIMDNLDGEYLLTRR